eukprot:TRINITY_DN28733_c0_g1_i1.p1 TRINITY_DN28733_c0_g1~~TRINITY_DN28733_c0_g1_i1.p1  ORF type:complete len:238 (+),score=72.00 TRINITY_DN28733_c0_g1_i1:170-883(+)
MHPGVKWVVGGWTAFFAENIIMSENRTEIIEAIGKEGYFATYSLLSTLSVASIATGYYRHADKAKRRSFPLRGAGLALRIMGASAVSQSLPALKNLSASADPAEYEGMKAFCPMDLKWAKNAEGKEVYGFKRITRHPQLWGAAVYGIGAAVGSACPVTAAAALGFTPCALVMGAHIDSRYERGIGGTMSDEVRETTSNIPFVAAAMGKQDVAAAIAESKQTNCMVAGLLVVASSLRA